MTPKPRNAEELVDSREQRDQAHFDAIATQYAAKDLAPSAQPARRLRLLQTIRALPAGTMTGARVLEIGCGAGYAVDYLTHNYASYLGIDYSQQLISLAQSLNRPDNASFQVGNARRLACDEPFDVIFMIGVLHHMDELDDSVAHMCKLLKPGGWMVVNEPQPANPLIEMARKARKRIDADYADDQCELTDWQIAALFTAAGLVDIRQRAQGEISTPFAEVPMRPSIITTPLSHLACWIDLGFESVGGRVLRSLSWNTIVAGRKP